MPSPNLDGFPASIDAYLDHCLARQHSPRSIEGARSALKAFAAWCLASGVQRPREVNEAHIESYLVYLSKYVQPRNGKALQLVSRRKRLTYVRVFFRWLRRNRRVLFDPMANFEMFRVGRQLPMGFLTEDEVERVLAQTLLHGCLGLRDRAILEVYYATGLRRMELARLELQDLDFETRVLTVHKGKGDKDRRVPIARRACAWVQRYLAEVRPSLARLDSGSALFLDGIGRRLREQQLTRLVSKYVKRAGLRRGGSCNLFRHTTATLMLQNRADLRYVQQMLGHEDISTTMIYTHVVIDDLRAVYERTHPAAKSSS